jgi:hypothetical protein
VQITTEPGTTVVPTIEMRCFYLRGVSKPSRFALGRRGKAGRLTLEFGYFQDFIRINKSPLFTKAERNLELWPKGRRERVPEGRCDRSLARSAWDSATQKSRPVGYGLIRAGVRTDSMIGVMKFRIRKLRHFAHVDEKYLWD